MTDKEFIEAVFEEVYGDNAINRGFSKQDVIEELQNMNNIIGGYENSETHVWHEVQTMNLQDMLDEYINFKIQEVLDVALANKEKTVTKELETMAQKLKALQEWMIEFDNNQDEIRALADENEYNLERQEERLNELEEVSVESNTGVIESKIKESLSKIKLTVE